MGCDIVTVSMDTKFVHKAWQENEKELAKVKYPMASDPTGKAARMFGVYDEDTGLALRGTFIINPQGVLMNAETNSSILAATLMSSCESTKRTSISPRKPTRPALQSGRTRETSPHPVGKNGGQSARGAAAEIAVFSFFQK